MPEIKVTPLGAGQDVGRSCLLLSMGGKNIMLDCGMHMGFNDERRFPDFSYIVPEGPITSHIDCVIISHFHLEHCGALPYLSEIIGFNGPIYMTQPTKALVPILYEELRRLNLQSKGRTNFVSTQEIKNCMKKVTVVELHQSVMVDNELEIKAYYAGHVLGAAMFWIKVGSQTVVYTGDFNMNPDRHLGAAWIDKCQPDLLITESTYATDNPKAKRCHKEDFLKSVHDCMTRGGKVLIPIFILGRAQELCLILDKYWQKMNFSYPMYFGTDSLTEKTNTYYKMFANWNNQQMHKSKAEGENVFELKHIKSFNAGCIDEPGPMVVLATNGMMQAGISLQIFKEWAGDVKNLVIFPDICQRGTLGHKIVSGAKQIELQNKDIIKVKLQVEQMSFDAIADANGIMQLIQSCAPKNVVLLHNRHENQKFLRSEIKKEINFDCQVLSNGETCVIETLLKLPTEDELNSFKNEKRICRARGPPPTPIQRSNIFTIHVAQEKRILMINLRVAEPCRENFNIEQTLTFCTKLKIDDSTTSNSKLKSHDKLFVLFKEKLKEWKVTLDESSKVIVEGVEMEIAVPNEKYPSEKILSISWKNQDDDIARYILELLSSFS